ncbi:MAG: hypothetical protein K5681_04260 [Treponema sp.]|nr:hypothetical protein [Treponema sp.]
MILPNMSFANESFYCEHLLDTEINELLIQNFTVKNPKGENLVKYLKNVSIQSESINENRTYLVKDKSTNEIAGYFALRNGLFTLHDPSHIERIITIPAIELSNFAVNETYRQSHPDMTKIGRAILYDFVIPISKYIQTLTAVQALYIYAIPEQPLINHYLSLGFERLSEDEEKFVHQTVKPAYDDGCVFMFQLL